MGNIRSIDMMFLDDVFGMGGGFVLNFSDRTFSEFFREELRINIDDPVYARNGGSKAKRLRCFLQTVDKPTVVRTLNALWEYREALQQRSSQIDAVKNAQDRFQSLINRLEGRPDSAKPRRPEQALVFDSQKIGQLKRDLLAVASLEAHARGYAFERFLCGLFETYGLAPQEPFRLRGEQIDGSFQFGNETYLVEAKWHGSPIGVADLHVFHGKIEQKAAWTRGLFVSNSGFSEDGLAAFGRGKRVVCMDGYDRLRALAAGAHDTEPRGIGDPSLPHGSTAREVCKQHAQPPTPGCMSGIRGAERQKSKASCTRRRRPGSGWPT